MSFLDSITAKINELQTTLSNHTAQVGQLSVTLEKLAADKHISLRNIDLINGAMHAYKDILALSTGNPIPAIEDALNLVTNESASAASTTCDSTTVTTQSGTQT